MVRSEVRTQEVQMKKRIMLPITILAILGLASCNLFFGRNTAGTITASDIAKFQKVFMSSYTAERGGTGGGARALAPFNAQSASSSMARATVPVNQFQNNSFLGLNPSSFANYPEPGQTTSFTISKYDAANNVYDVTATTTYSPGDSRSTYVEEYYVRDIGKNGSGFFDTGTPDARWTVDDPIVKWTGTWVQDQKARVRQILTFADGTTRSETILSQTDFTSGNPKFARFDVNGSLSFGQLFIPATDNAAVFSSVVVYTVTPSTNPNFWFWQGSNAQTILGIRYYTEFASGGQYNTYTISFEKTLSTFSTQGISTPLVWSTVFVGSQFDTLAESVLRQQVTYSTDSNGTPILSTGTSTTNMQSRVVDITGQKDFYLTQLNSDYVSLSGWDTTTVYTPTGDAAEILAGDPNRFVYSRTGTVAGSSTPLAILTSSLPSSGLGDLAGLYTSLTTGAATLPVASNPLPPSSSPPYLVNTDTTELQFNGTTQGTVVDYDPTYDLFPKGTIEAWVYIKQQMDTAGIVHKGESPTFNDECYSLQFWGNQGQIALAIDNSSGSYDLLTSTINLNTGRWYYLVATWDGTTMKLYINGVLNKSKAQTLSGAPQTNSSKLLIGSQLPNMYSPAYGYFTFNGAIYGVKVYSTPTPPDATAILSFYNANKASTASWPHP